MLEDKILTSFKKRDTQQELDEPWHEKDGQTLAVPAHMEEYQSVREIDLHPTDRPRLGFCRL